MKVNQLNIHQPELLPGGGCRLSASLETDGRVRGREQYIQISNLWGELGEIDNSGDVWSILFLPKMMEVGGKFIIHGAISSSLLPHLDLYAKCWHLLMPSTFHPVELIPDEVIDDSAREQPAKTLTCFSGGLDACFTLYRHVKGLAGAQTREVRGCMMLHGADIRKDKEEEWCGALKSAEALVKDLGIPNMYVVKTNFRDMHCPYLMSYTALLVACMRVLSKQYGYLMLGSDNPAHCFVYPEGNNPVTNPMLSSHACEIVTDGLDHTRTEKAAIVAQWPMAMEKLRCCYMGEDLSKNCGKCSKCKRTRLNFLAVGATETPFMPPAGSVQEMLDFPLNRIEHMEISTLLDYLDAHPLPTRQAWEIGLREKLSRGIVGVEPAQPFIKRIRTWRKKLSLHLKLFRKRKEVKELCVGSESRGFKGYKKVMKELHGLISDGKGSPLGALISDYFQYNLQYDGKSLDDYVFTGEWSARYTSLVNQHIKNDELLQFDQKAFQKEILAKHNIPTAKLFGRIERNEQGICIVSSDGQHAKSFLDILASEKRIFCKPDAGQQGMGCVLVEYADGNILANGRMVDRAGDLSRLLPDGILVERVVRQHKNMEALHAGSINTLRLVTMQDPCGEPRLIAQCLRIGVGDTPVDNWSANGLVVGINDDGTLKRIAHSKQLLHNEYDRHPDTGIGFHGYKIPFFRESADVVLRAHRSLPKLFAVGWDVAVTPNGPCVIEMNMQFGIQTIQQACGGLRGVFNTMLCSAHASEGIVKARPCA